MRNLCYGAMNNQGKSRHGFKLSGKDLRTIDRLLKVGDLPVRVVKRALILRNAHKGLKQVTIAEFLGITDRTVQNTVKTYKEGGLDSALYDKPIPGKAPLLTDSQGNQIIAMVTSDPPEGYERWTVRLIAKEAKARSIVKEVGKDTIHKLMRSHELKPWREKNVVHPRDNGGVYQADGSDFEPLQ